MHLVEMRSLMLQILIRCVFSPKQLAQVVTIMHPIFIDSVTCACALLGVDGLLKADQLCNSVASNQVVHGDRE